ncbi:fasciclin-like arabinogalactan protein 21 [Malania oleifera]|uniref:fasciclin-like arabinogalactan protein 21 n=1 Tax=Malania oleifera TaxID=397392 RepID=UPI0025AE7820|nr:fasciclin-like arabinogalactan protein 21 [Malania oleifera]
MAIACSRWWHAPIYFTVSVVLAVMAISTALHPESDSAIPSNTAALRELTRNASQALRKPGFNAIATLLQISPELFLSPSSQSTIFAIHDSAISNLTLTPWLAKPLLQYHTFPSKLSLRDLLAKPQGTCLQTRLKGKNAAITKIDAKQRSLEINNVSISHADLFLGGPISIHGVLEPFSPLDPQDVRQGWAFIRSPICDSNHRLVSGFGKSKNIPEWNRIIRLLSLNGFVSFAVGLHAVLDNLLEDCMDLSDLTVFAPPDLAFVASPLPLLDRIVRLHILPRRFTYAEMGALPEKASLRTLLPDMDLEISGRGVNMSAGLAVNGVEITAPEIFSSENFMVHGISRALELAELPNSS